MTRIIRRSLHPTPVSATLVCLAIALTSHSACGQDKSTTYSAEELVAAVTQRLSEVTSLYCEYTIRYGNNADPVRCRYARTGDKWHYSELSHDQARMADKQNTYCFDGDIVYAYVIRSQANDEDVEWSSVHLQDPRAQGNLCPDFLLGAKLSNIGRSIPEALEMAENVAKSGEMASADTITTTLAARGILAARTGPEQMKYDLSIALDPEHDFLPREIRITESDENITWPGWANHWTILEYREVLDERADRKRWFPVSGILKQGGTDAPTIEMLIDDARINSDLPSSLFHPEIPDGVTIADTTAAGHGRMAIKGGKPAIDTRMKELVGRAREAAGQSATSRMWLVVINVVLLAILLLVYVVRKRVLQSSQRKKG